jgi:hypothetical protein
MDIIKCSDEEWDDSQEMLSGNDSALSGFFNINPQDTSPGYWRMKNDDVRMASTTFAYVGYVEE